MVKVGSKLVKRFFKAKSRVPGLFTSAASN